VNRTPTFRNESRTGKPRARPARLLAPVMSALLLATPPLWAADGQAAAPAADPVGDYLAAIERSEAQSGSYATELVDLYHGMGQTLLEQGEFEEARDAFYRAAMIARVNSGPLSLEQTNYLYSIADVESRMGRPEAAVQALEHIYQLNARHFGEDSAAMLPVAQRIHAWFSDRLTWEGVPVRPSDFQNLSYLMARIARLTEASYGLGDVRTAMGYRALGQSHFEAIRHMVLTGETPQPGLVMDSVDEADWVPSQHALVGHVMQGEDALERAIQSWQENPAGSDLEVAEAVAQLGDWNLALEFSRSAARNYEEAYRLLAGSPEFGFLADDYLGKPSPLRLMNNVAGFVRDLDPPDAESSLAISMTVTPDGRLHDLQMVTAPAGVTADQWQKFRDNLATVLFRPAVVAGEVQTLENFVWKTSVRLTVPAPPPEPATDSASPSSASPAPGPTPGAPPGAPPGLGKGR
jgi:tetratricopeptide (TPR) repeat protein